MAGFIELMKHSKISVTSPDGRISAVMTGGADVEFHITREVYKRYTEETLCLQFAELVKRVFEARAEARRQALSQAVDDEVTTRREYELTEKERRFRLLRDEVTAVGASEDKAIRVKKTGSHGWAVKIAPGTIQSRSEADFLAGFRRALAVAVKKYRVEVAQARVAVYGDQDLKRYR